MDDFIVVDEDQKQEEPVKEDPKEKELEELKAKAAELDQIKSELEALKQQLKPPQPELQPQPQPQTSVNLHEELARLKLSQAIAGDDLAQKYRDEIEQAIASVAPELRASDFTIQAAIAYVKGRHVNEIVESLKKQPPPEVTSSSAAGEPPKPEKPKVELTERGKIVLEAWFDGDLSVAESLIGGGE